MTLHRVNCDQVAPQPWRNGAGRTRELLAWPQADGWQLRISVADIDRDAPFSAYPGVDRWLALVDGAGVALRLPQGLQRLEPGSPPLAFAGEAAPACTLLDGPTRDLNLMCRRGAGRAQLWPAGPGVELPVRGTLRALFSADAARLQVDDADAHDLPAFTLAWSTAPGRWRLRCEVPRPRAWWLHFDARSTA
jgi:environmental stress-induced protein Ves